MALIDRIKYDSTSDEVLVFKFTSEELKLGSQLVVNQSQEALFLKGGEVCDLFGPGTHTLSAANLPLLNKLVNLPFGGKTPFSAEVWFINKTVKRDLKWGTQAPVPLIDPTYNYPISVRAFGRWGLRIQDSRMFVLHIVGKEPELLMALADPLYGVGGITNRLLQKTSTRLGPKVGRGPRSVVGSIAKMSAMSSGKLREWDA